MMLTYQSPPIILCRGRYFVLFSPKTGYKGEAYRSHVVKKAHKV